MKARQKLMVIAFQSLIIGLFASCASVGQHNIIENNPYNFSDFIGEKLTVQIHMVFWPWYHASIRITLDSDELLEKYRDGDEFIQIDDNGLKYITLGSGPNNRILNRQLVAEFNRPRDINNDIKVETYSFDLPKENNIEVIEKILDAFKAYNNDLSYSYFPNTRNKKFNSNSFITGLLSNVGLEIPKFNDKYKLPGYNKPIPLISYDLTIP